MGIDSPRNGNDFDGFIDNMFAHAGIPKGARERRNSVPDFLMENNSFFVLGTSCDIVYDIARCSIVKNKWLSTVKVHSYSELDEDCYFRDEKLIAVVMIDLTSKDFRKNGYLFDIVNAAYKSGCKIVVHSDDDNKDRFDSFFYPAQSIVEKFKYVRGK